MKVIGGVKTIEEKVIGDIIGDVIGWYGKRHV